MSNLRTWIESEILNIEKLHAFLRSIAYRYHCYIARKKARLIDSSKIR